MTDHADQSSDTDEGRGCDPSGPSGQRSLWDGPPKLAVVSVGGITKVLLDALPLAVFPDTDRKARNLAIVSLAEGGAVRPAEIARAFGIGESRVSQLRRRYRDGGADLLLRDLGAPRGLRALSPREAEQVRKWRREGHTVDVILKFLGAKGIRVGRRTVFRVVRGIAPAVEREISFDVSDQGEAGLEPVNEAAQTPVTTGSAAAVADPLPAMAAAAARTETVGPPAAIEAAVVDVAVAGPAPAMVDTAAAGADSVDVAVKVESASPETKSSERACELGSPEESANEAQKLAIPADSWRETTVAGAMVVHAALDALGLREALASSGARLRPAHTFDLLRTAGVLVLGVLLRYRTVESLRMLIRRDFGALLGIEQAPEIRTVRRKLKEIAAPDTGFSGTQFMRQLARSLLREAAAPEGVFFFDDHFAPYFGKQPLGKGWDAKRRLGAPGREDVYVHDLKGRAVLFVPLPAPTSLSQALPLALQELREIGAATRLAVFDRGGWSRELFRSLVTPADGAARVDFVTYLTARHKPRQIPAHRFRKVTLEEAGHEHVYQVAERTLKLRGFTKPLRVIVLHDTDRDRQIPILTSMSAPDLPPERVVHLLRSRWRQENSFKYLVGELGIDALVAHDLRLLQDERLVDNPEREAIKAELADARHALQQHERALGQAVLANQEARRPTVRGFKIANSELLRERDEAAHRVLILEEDLASTPAKVTQTAIDPKAQRAVENTQRRLFVNGLKLLVHNAEKWLADRLAPGPYGQYALPILRALFGQPGRLRRGGDRIIVEIRPLDTPRYQRHVVQLFEALNARGAKLLDSELRLEFRTQPAEDGER